MDKELEKIVREAHSMGATESDLNQIVDTYKKKSISLKGSQIGSKTLPFGSKPFLPQVDTKAPSVLTPKGKVEYQEQVKAFKPQEIAKEGQPKPPKKADGGGATAFMADLNRFNSSIFKLPRLTYDVASSITDAALQALNLQQDETNYDDIVAASGYTSPLSVLDRLGDYYAGKSNQYTQRQEKFDKGIIDSFTSGDIKNGGKQLWNNIAGSIPSMVGMAVTGGAGNIAKLGYAQKTLASALPFISGRNAELSQDESIPKPVRVANSVLNGYSEVIFDQSFGATAMISKVIGDVFKNEGRDAAVKAAKDFTKGFATEAIKKIQPFTGTTKGVVEEMSTKLSQNIVDKYTINPDKDLMEGVLDAGLVGGVMTGGIGAIGTVAYSSSQKKKAVDLMKQREEIVDDLDNDNLPDDVKDDLSDKLSKIDESINKIDDDNEIVISKLSDEDKTVLKQKESKIQSIEQALQDESLSETAKNTLADNLLKEQDSVDEILTKPKIDAIQVETAGQVPVLTEAPVGEEVEQGKPQPKTEVVTEEGAKAEEVGSGVDVKITGDIGIDKSSIPLDKKSQPVNLGSILATNGDKLDLSAEEINLSYPGKKKYVRKITATNGAEKAIISFWKNGNKLIILHVESSKKGAGYGTDLINKVIKEAKEAGVEEIVADNVESLSSQKYWEKQGFIQDPDSRSNRILTLSTTQEQTPAQEVEQLRASEQAELKAAIPNADQYLTDGKVDRAKITDAKDLKKFDKIWKKYDRFITPKLKEAKADAEVAELEKIFASITTPSTENKGVSVTNKSVINEVKTKSKDTNKIKVVESAQKLLKTLQSVLPKFDIVIHDNEGSYNSSMSDVNGLANSAGNFSYVKNQDGSYSGRIDINLDKANSRTVAHEVAHGIMLKAFGDNPPLFKNFRDKISKVLSETANKDLMDFANQYKGDVAYEEYLVELSAMLSEQGGKISPTSLQKIAAIINDIVSRLTKGSFKPFEDIKNTNDIIDFFNTISGAIREGSEIQQLNIKEPYSSGVALPVTNPNEFVGKKFKSKASIGDYKFPSGIDALKIADIPIKNLTELVRQYKGRVVIITSDATGYGVDKNGDPILGGFGFASNKKNVSDGIGFASVSTSTVKSTYTAAEKAYGTGKSLVLIMIQPPHTTINNSYGAKYIIRGLKEIASSSKKDLIKTKEAITNFIKGSKAIQQELKNNPASLKRGSEKRLFDLIDSIDENINLGEYVNEFLLDTTFTIRKELAKGIILENKNIRTNKSTNYSKIALNNVGYNIYDFLKEYGDNTILTDDLILNNTGGYVVGGFELNVLPNNQREDLIDNIQNKGIVHPLFNAKLPGTNHFRLDGLYDVQENFSKYARPDTEISLAKEDRDNLVREIYKNDKFYNADARLIPLEERSYTNLTVPAKIEFKDKYLKQRGLLTESVPSVPTKVAKGEGFIPIENAAKEMSKREFVPISKSQINDALSKASGTTQVATTTGSYIKAANILKDLGVSNNVLDYGAGLGLGTDAMSDVIGNSVDSLEVNPERWKGRTPVKYTDSAQINKKYEGIVSLNVVNVVPKNVRDFIVIDIFNNLKKGGKAIISSRGFTGDINQAKNFVPGPEEKSYIIKRVKDGKVIDVFQKGYDGNELVNYVKDLLGDLAEVKANNTFGNRGVVITKVSEFKDQPTSKAQLGTPDDIKQLISQARSKGLSDNAIETFLKSKGFDVNEIKAQMGKPVVELKQDVKEGKGKVKRISFEDINNLTELGVTYIEESVKDLKDITFEEFSTKLQDEYGQDIPENIIRNIFKKSAAAIKLGVRRTPERMGTGDGVSASLKEVANETAALYQKQDYKGIQDRLDSMSEAEKTSLVGTLASVTGQLNAEDNVGVLAAIDLINIYEANGDKEAAKRVFDVISKSATAFAQLLRQYGQLKSSTPQGYVSIIEKDMLDKYDVKLTDAQKQNIEKLYNDSKKAIDIEADALNNLVDDLTDVNYKLWGQTTVLLEDANRRLADYIESLKPATAQSLFQKLTSIVQGDLLTLKSLLVNPVSNAAQAGTKLSGNEVANLFDFIINTTLKTGRTKISGFDPLAIRLGGKAFTRGLSKANRMLIKGATSTDLAKIDVAGRLKPVEAWKSLYKTLRGKQAFEFVKTIENLAEGTIGVPANLLLRLLPYGDLPRNEQVKIAKLIEIGRNKFGLKGKELEVFTLKPDPESLAEAELEGDKSTLQESNKVYRTINDLINSIDSKGDDKFVKGLLSGIKFIVRGTQAPFLKTPINYAFKTIRFTNPIIPYSQAVYHMVKAIQSAKNIKNPLLRESAIRKHQSKLTEYLGEAVIAQSIMSAALILIGNGLVTGSAPEEDKYSRERNLMFQSVGPNMINISGLKRLLTGGDPTYKPEDTAIAYNALGILGAQLGISSNTLTKKEKENIREKKFITTEGKPFYEEDKGFYLTSIVDMLANLPASLNYTLNQGFAQGTGTLLASISDNEYSKWSDQMVKTLVTGLAVPNTVYQSFKAGNDYYRDVYTEDQVEEWANIVQERYGNLEGLPIKYDMFGKPIKLTPEGSNPYVYNVLDIFRTQKILQNKNIYYVFDLYKKTGDMSVIPNSVKDIIDEEGGLYTKLTPDQKSELQRIVGEERAKYLNGDRGGSLSLKNYDPTNDSEVYWEKQVKKLKSANKLGLSSGKRRFEKEILNKTKK